MSFLKYSNLNLLNKVYHDKDFIAKLKSFLERDFSTVSDEAGDIINSAWVKLTEKFSSGKIVLEEENEATMKRYLKSAVKFAAIDLIRRRYPENKGISPNMLITDEGWSGGSFRGVDISQEDVADRGWGSFPSDPNDKILLEQTNRMLRSPGKELGSFDKEKIRNILDDTGGYNELNPTEPGRVEFRDVAKRDLKQRGLDYDYQMGRVRENKNDFAFKELGKYLDKELKTRENTLNRRRGRSEEVLNQWLDNSVNRTDIKESSLLANLIKMAGQLDAIGFRKEADFADSLIRKVVTKRAGYASDPDPKVFMGFDPGILFQAYKDVENPNTGLWEGPQYKTSAEAFDAYLLNTDIGPLDESEAKRYRKLSGDTRAKLWWVVHEAITPSWEKQMVQKVEKKWKIPSPEELNRKVASRGKGTSEC